MITRRLLISTLSVFGVSGCAIAVGKKFQTLEPISDRWSHIYFFRSESEKTGVYPDIYVNGQFVGPLKRGGYLLANVPPGKVEISIPATITWWPLGALTKEIQVEGGKRYFINLHTSDGGFNEESKKRVIHVDALRLVSEQVAIPVLQRSVLSR